MSAPQQRYELLHLAAPLTTELLCTSLSRAGNVCALNGQRLLDYTEKTTATKEYHPNQQQTATATDPSRQLQQAAVTH